MNIEAGQIREKMYNALKYNDTWELFSNHGEGDDAHANSLEAVHDDIHVIVGYGRIPGHMTHPYFAGKCLAYCSCPLTEYGAKL